MKAHYFPLALCLFLFLAIPVSWSCVLWNLILEFFFPVSFCIFWMPCFRCVWICERQYYQYRKISVDRLENQFDSQGDKSRLERERIEAYRRSFDFPDSHRCVPLFEARSRVEETAADRDRGKNCFLCSVRQCYYRKIFGRLSRVRIRQPRGEQTETEKIEAYRSSSSFPHSHRWCVLLSEARTCGEETAAGIRDREEVLLHCSRSCLLKVRLLFWS